MSKMGWLHHLVEIAHYTDNKKELEEYLGELNFKDKSLAAREFLTAYAELIPKETANDRSTDKNSG